MNDLERYFEHNSGNLIRKWRHYFEIYDRYFAGFRDKEVHVLEFGVLHGGSLQMWKHYFGPQARIYGVDINPQCKQLEEDRIKIFIGDQEDTGFLNTLISAVPRLDILIDDGGHTMKQQKNTFEVLFPHIDANGIYICEDLHTSYWGSFGGGLLAGKSFIEYSKSLIDDIHAWHCKGHGNLSVSEFTRSAYALHYYNSMLVIEKRPISEPDELQSGVPRVRPLPPGHTSSLRRFLNRFFS